MAHARALIRDAFEKMWQLCSERYERLSSHERQQARERLAACLVLIAARTDSPTSFDTTLLTEDFVHRLCETDCLVNNSSVMDFGEKDGC